ncbi:polynucleotide kinase [Laspinema olomoucense]|uniref:polynucleotide kinase n=1 Tax=Laspinema olomoucense TaxID=3231600 RepID=UPI0021BAD790|nr:polynucleotide kinase [Laspinema sp. D3d]MCT7971089.1 polynucleotide kinase [Laspinema sp. D3d]
MNKLLLLDKDGTLISPKSGEKFVQSPWDQSPLPGVKEAISEARKNGWDIAVCSNQGGIDAGYKSLENCFQEMRFLLELFPEISECYFCPANYGFTGKECWRCWGKCLDDERIKYNQFASELSWSQYGKVDYRKPGGGMLILAQSINNADKVYFVGDRPEDEQAAANSYIPFLSADDWRGCFSGQSISPLQIKFLENLRTI